MFSSCWNSRPADQKQHFKFVCYSPNGERYPSVLGSICLYQPNIAIHIRFESRSISPAGDDVNQQFGNIQQIAEVIMETTDKLTMRQLRSRRNIFVISERNQHCCRRMDCWKIRIFVKADRVLSMPSDDLGPKANSPAHRSPPSLPLVRESLPIQWHSRCCISSCW